MDALMAASEEDVSRISGVGAIMARSICEFFAESQNRELIEKLRDAGVRMADAAKAAPTGPQPLAGKTYVLTGRLEGMSRPQAEARLKALGAQTTSTVTKKTTAVIVGADAGSKADRAVALKVPTMDEAALLALLEENDAGGNGTSDEDAPRESVSDPAPAQGALPL
jgi:DNA ligase (NAD+)